VFYELCLGASPQQVGATHRCCDCCSAVGSIVCLFDRDGLTVQKQALKLADPHTFRYTAQGTCDIDGVSGWRVV